LYLQQFPKRIIEEHERKVWKSMEYLGRTFRGMGEHRVALDRSSFIASMTYFRFVSKLLQNSLFLVLREFDLSFLFWTYFSDNSTKWTLEVHYLFPLVCITVFGHCTLHRQNLADIGLAWSKKIRRSLKILDTIILPS
jgi:hypothetical protein